MDHILYFQDRIIPIFTLLKNLFWSSLLKTLFLILIFFCKSHLIFFAIIKYGFHTLLSVQNYPNFHLIKKHILDFSSEKLVSNFNFFAVLIYLFFFAIIKYGSHTLLSRQNHPNFHVIKKHIQKFTFENFVSTCTKITQVYK